MNRPWILVGTSTKPRGSPQYHNTVAASKDDARSEEAYCWPRATRAGVYLYVHVYVFVHVDQYVYVCVCGGRGTCMHVHVQFVYLKDYKFAAK
jgi:hypothetical protein